MMTKMYYYLQLIVVCILFSSIVYGSSYDVNNPDSFVAAFKYNQDLSLWDSQRSIGFGNLYSDPVTGDMLSESEARQRQFQARQNEVNRILTNSENLPEGYTAKVDVQGNFIGLELPNGLVREITLEENGLRIGNRVFYEDDDGEIQVVGRFRTDPTDEEKAIFREIMDNGPEYLMDTSIFEEFPNYFETPYKGVTLMGDDNTIPTVNAGDVVMNHNGYTYLRYTETDDEGVEHTRFRRVTQDSDGNWREASTFERAFTAQNINAVREATTAAASWNTLFGDEDKYNQRLGEFYDRFGRYFPQNFLAQYTYGQLFSACRDTMRTPLVSDGQAMIGTPSGRQYAASVQATISHIVHPPACANCEGETEYLYKISYHLRNPTASGWSYEVFIDNRRIESGSVSAYGAAGRGVQDMLVRYTDQRYSRVCIRVSGAQFSEVCNRIVEESQSPTNFQPNRLMQGGEEQYDDW